MPNYMSPTEWGRFEKFVILSLKSAVHYIYTTQLCSEKCVCGVNHTFKDGGHT